MKHNYKIIAGIFALITILLVLFAGSTTLITFDEYSMRIPNIAALTTEQDSNSVTYTIKVIKWIDQQVIDLEELNQEISDEIDENIIYFKDNSQYGVKYEKNVTDWNNEYKLVFVKRDVSMIDEVETIEDGFFDLHADVLFDVLDKSQYSMDDMVLKHLNEQLEGQITGGFWMLYFPNDYDYDIDLAVNVILRRLEDHEEVSKRNIILGFEGLGKIESLEHLETMFDQGFKIATLTWNDVNKWATGTFTNTDRGLTSDGILLVQKMEELGMIIDVSHANERTFYDIFDNTEGVLIASHSNAYTLAENERNLTDDQLKKIAERNGVVGVTTIEHYISTNPTNQNVSGMVDHIDYIVDLIGIDHVAIGFDFVDYLDDASNIDDVSNETMAYVVKDELVRTGYTEEEIQKIMYLNVNRVIEAVIKD